MKVKIVLTYKTPKGVTTVFESEEMQAEAAVMIAGDLERTGRVKELIFIDHHDSSWTMKEIKKYIEGIQTEPHNVTVYFDGGFDLETKKSGLGCVVYYDQHNKSYRLRRNVLVDNLDTNNEAEYAAFHFCLQELEELGVHHLPVTFIGDSQVVLNQLSKDWPIYEEELNKWADRIEVKLKQMGIEPEFELVSRKKNREADQLASQAMKNIEITSTSERTE